MPIEILGTWARVGFMTTLFLVSGCGSSNRSQASDASTGAASSDGSGGDAPTATTCQGVSCPVINSQAAGLGIAACCTTDGMCGAQTPLAPGCLPYKAKGSTDPSCPAYQAPTGSLPGCCRPEGQCGAFDGTLGLGCIANTSLAQPTKSCTYDATNDCPTVTALVCDGPEDCPSGTTCCGNYAGGAYSQFECRSSCAAVDGGGLWFELCHYGQTCQDKTTMCLSSMYLPSNLYRCYTTGNPPPATATATPGVNCGTMACGAGQTCCLRAPHDPYCAPGGEACRCGGPSAGDAGGDAAGDGGGSDVDAAPQPPGDAGGTG